MFNRLRHLRTRGTPNAQGKRRRSTEGAEGTNAGHEDAEGMACVGVRLTDQLGAAHVLTVSLTRQGVGLIEQQGQCF